MRPPARAEAGPWRPITPSTGHSPYEPSAPSDTASFFSVVEAGSGSLADNAAMIGAASRAGFTLEGTLRRSAWLAGAFVDEVILGLPVEEWKRGAEPRQ